ncbi:DUF2235 domain-containing protein [Microcoleus sp. K1-B1]|uniref:DUF2235 domain-containing protein n=2 Tax=unclassified Microcoleus TaxID=2642155 RepID=UPI002FD417B3
MPAKYRFPAINNQRSLSGDRNTGIGNSLVTDYQRQLALQFQIQRENIKMTKPGKRLIVCCDGTWNKLDTQCPTNVVRLAQAVKRTASDGVPQIVFYDEGIGVDSNKIVGGVTGLGIDKNIQDAYRFLSFNYDQGDEIYLFGFSRGAYTVRSLAGMIYCSGLLSRRNVTMASQAYELYRKREISPKHSEAKSFREKFGKDKGDRVPITLLGCFDTVGALGIPLVPAFRKFEGQIKARYKFHDTTLNKDIENAVHAVAIDEIREVFDVTLMKKNPDAPNQKLRQVWFPGEHGCIGGGTPEYRGLSDAVLKWMLDQISDFELKLEFEPEAIEDIKPDYKVPFQNNPGFFKLAGIKWREVGETLEDLHESAIERLKKRQDYRPKNLQKILSKVIENIEK